MKSPVHIEKPCSQNWETMALGLHVRFCNQCSRNVIDFTGKSKQEIIEYVLLNYNNKSCGRFHRSQLDFTYEDLMITVKDVAAKRSGSNLPFLMLTVGSLMLVGCGNSVSPDTHQTIVADTAAMPDTVVIPGKDSSKKVDLLPHFNPGDDMIMGDIEVLPNYRTDDDSVLTFAEKMPEFKGGIDKLMRFVETNMLYPEWEKEHKIEGNVVAQFTIDTAGHIKAPSIIRSVDGAQNFDKEVLRILTLMPAWIPGEQGGRKVEVKYILPFKFKL